MSETENRPTAIDIASQVAAEAWVRTEEEAVALLAKEFTMPRETPVKNALGKVKQVAQIGLQAFQDGLIGALTGLSVAIVAHDPPILTGTFVAFGAAMTAFIGYQCRRSPISPIS